MLRMDCGLTCSNNRAVLDLCQFSGFSIGSNVDNDDDIVNNNYDNDIDDSEG